MSDYCSSLSLQLYTIVGSKSPVPFMSEIAVVVVANVEMVVQVSAVVQAAVYVLVVIW